MEDFFLHPDDVLTKVVQEFYAHLTYPNNAFIYVKGTLILLDEDLINTHYGLHNVPNEHSHFPVTISAEGLNLLKYLCIDDTKCMVSK